MSRGLYLRHCTDPCRSDSARGSGSSRPIGDPRKCHRDGPCHSGSLCSRWRLVDCSHRRWARSSLPDSQRGPRYPRQATPPSSPPDAVSPCRLIALDLVDQVILPRLRIARTLVADLVKHIVQVIDRVDHFAHIRFLQGRDRRDAQRVCLFALPFPLGPRPPR